MNTIAINPPPSDRRCECCGKLADELKPFGKAGDPLVGDFDGAKLVKSFRNLFPHIKELDKQIKELKSQKGWDNLELANKELYDKLSFYTQAITTISSSWECRDCIILDDEEYWETMKKRRPNAKHN